MTGFSAGLEISMSEGRGSLESRRTEGQGLERKRSVGCWRRVFVS